MPCSVSKDEAEAYEKLYNQKEYGLEWTDQKLTEAVACKLGDILKERGLDKELPAYVMGWLESHKKRELEEGWTK